MSKSKTSNLVGSPLLTQVKSGGARQAESDEEFQRFEGLTRKLIQVPKKELDERRNGSKS
jgi:hypothetical protein